MYNSALHRALAFAALLGLTAVCLAPAGAQMPPGGPGMGRPGMGGPGGPGGRRPIMIVGLPVATLDSIVHLTPDQKKKVTALHDSYVATAKASRPQPGQMPDRAAFQKLRDQGRQANDAIEALLTPTQKTKLDAARQDMNAYRIAGIPLGLYGQLKLTPAQLTQLKALRPPGPPANGSAERPNFQMMIAAMQELRTKAQAILTPAQKAQIEKYQKEHPEEGGFGGFGGPGGPGGRRGFGGPGGPGGFRGPGGPGGRPGGQ